MINLRLATMRILLEIHDEVYFQEATKEARFPYVVYDFPNSFDNENQEVFNFDVDVWDNNENTVPLETIASTYWKLFNRYHYLDENIQFSVYRGNRLPPLDEDNTGIKRRKLIFQLRYFDRQL